MAETLTQSDDGTTVKWLWFNVMHDLKIQGGLQAIIINPLTVKKHGCSGNFGNCLFHITWVHKCFLLLSMTEECRELVDAFSVILGYKPFCKYVSRHSGLITYEWSEIDAEERFSKLERELSLEKL